MPPWVLFLQMQELRRIKGSLDALINQRDIISDIYQDKYSGLQKPIRASFM